MTEHQEEWWPECEGLPNAHVSIQPTTAKIALRTCQAWHYTGCVSAAIALAFACYERGRFVGVIVFGSGACPSIGKPFDVPGSVCRELVRVAMRDHERQVTEHLAMAIRELKRLRPKVRVLVSYADTEQGHTGTIYQAGNWLYIGDSLGHYYVVNGKRWHGRSLGSKYGKGGQSVAWLRENIDPEAMRVKAEPKHKYVYPLDKKMRRRVLRMAKPFPTKARR